MIGGHELQHKLQHLLQKWEHSRKCTIGAQTVSFAMIMGAIADKEKCRFEQNEGGILRFRTFWILDKFDMYCKDF